MFDLPLPVIIGQDITGVVAAVGSGVTTLHPGQAVDSIADMQLSGAYAEYALGYAEAIALYHQQIQRSGRVRLAERDRYELSSNWIVPS
jgi:NADPH:quinone reductase-like Zn-dependent oxidoreductase